MVKANEPIPYLLNDDMILGLMLSDGYLINHEKTTGHSAFVLGQTPKRIDFLNSVHDYFLTLGLKSSLRTTYTTIKGVKFPSILLTTSNNIVFDKLRNDWYPNGKKIIPKDLILNQKIISFWYQGDGYSRYINNGQSVEITIATDSFKKEDVDRICLQLKTRFNLNFHDWFRYKKYHTLKTYENQTTERFMNLVEPYIHPVFQYKIKHLDKFTKFKELKESGKLYKCGSSYRLALTPNIFCKSKIPN